MCCFPNSSLSYYRIFLVLYVIYCIGSFVWHTHCYITMEAPVTKTSYGVWNFFGSKPEVVEAALIGAAAVQLIFLFLPITVEVKMYFERSCFGLHKKRYPRLLAVFSSFLSLNFLNVLLQFIDLFDGASHGLAFEIFEVIFILVWTYVLIPLTKWRREELEATRATPLPTEDPDRTIASDPRVPDSINLNEV